jgi:hypothetical protein
MPRPPEGYRLADGTQVPGTTDITGRFGNKEPLIAWARKQGFEQAKAGLEKPDHRERSALDIGTVVHGMIELHLKGHDSEAVTTYGRSLLKDLEHWRKGFVSFQAFLTWAKTFRLHVVEMEMSLVSKRYCFGGTLDVVAEIGGGRLAIVDFKTSPTAYVENLIQLAAYRQLWEENRERRLTGGFYLICCPKDGSRCKPFHYPHLRDAWRQFVVLRRAYDLDRKLPGILPGVRIKPPAAPAARPKAVRGPFVSYGVTTVVKFQTAADPPIAAGSGTAREPEAPSVLSPPGSAPVAVPEELPPAGTERSTAPGGSDRGRERGEEPLSRNPPDLSIPDFLSRAGDGWASHDKARA